MTPKAGKVALAHCMGSVNRPVKRNIAGPAFSLALACHESCFAIQGNLVMPVGAWYEQYLTS
jgi:hypothetical protein